MSAKTANVTARVQPEIKAQAEAVLNKIGVPVSVLIDTLYRQIIMTGSIPYSLSVPKIQTAEDMTPARLDAVLQAGCDDAAAGKGLPLDKAFEIIKQEI